jgi:hypothetical protein
MPTECSPDFFGFEPVEGPRGGSGVRCGRGHVGCRSAAVGRDGSFLPRERAKALIEAIFHNPRPRTHFGRLLPPVQGRRCEMHRPVGTPLSIFGLLYRSWRSAVDTVRCGKSRRVDSILGASGRNHPPAAGATVRDCLAQQLRQLGDVGGDPSGLVASDQMCGRAPPRASAAISAMRSRYRRSGFRTASWDFGFGAACASSPIAPAAERARWRSGLGLSSSPIGSRRVPVRRASNQAQ